MVVFKVPFPLRVEGEDEGASKNLVFSTHHPNPLRPAEVGMAPFQQTDFVTTRLGLRLLLAYSIWAMRSKLACDIKA